MSLLQIGAAAARGALGRTFLLEKRTDGIPRVVIIFDVVKSEMPEFEAEVTLVPTEDGPEVTDHIQLKNPTLKLEGTISESPIDLEVQALNIASGGIEALTNNQSRSNFLDAGINALGGIAGASLLGNASKGDAIGGLTDGIARAALLSAYEKRGRFSVVTKRHQYDDMVIQKLAFPKTPETGRALDFSLTFQQIRVASPFSVNVDKVGDSVISSATTEILQGSQVGNVVSAAQDASINSSTLFNLFN